MALHIRIMMRRGANVYRDATSVSDRLFRARQTRHAAVRALAAVGRAGSGQFTLSPPRRKVGAKAPSVFPETFASLQLFAPLRCQDEICPLPPGGIRMTPRVEPDGLAGEAER